MAEVEPMKVDGVDVGKPVNGSLYERKRPPKRKRLEPCAFSPSPEVKQAKIVGFRNEIDSLVKYCKNLVSENKGVLLESLEKFENSSASVNSVIACLMEESDLPLSKLVDEVFEKVRDRKGNCTALSKASVKNAVLIMGQRLCYGVVGADADVLEDEAERALWYWETRDLKLLPKSACISLKVHRTCRRKIQERISAVLAMIKALEKSENSPNCQHELMKASEKLDKVLNEADIRLLMENMSHKNGAEMADKETKKGEKLVIKQMEKNKREKERERKKIERERQKEMLQSERELKRLHDEAEKEARRREKEEIEKQKQLKRQQEEAEKDQKRREKEEAESRKRLVLQKQASLMERFLKRKKTSSPLQNDSLVNKETTSGSSCNMVERNFKSVTLAMDTVLAQNDGIEVKDIWKSHLNAWRSNRCSIRSRHWGTRQKPKTELVKELKLTNKEQTWHEDLNIEKLVVGLDGTNSDGRLPQMNMDDCLRPCGTKRVPVKLLQFDRSNRPAFYGVWPRKSQVVGPRHPFIKDSDIDYDIDSDEEWAEDEPGESLSDCDKDEQYESMEEPIKDDEEDDSEDGFFVPDGYLSEDEGVKADELDNHDLDSEVQNLPTSEWQLQNDEFCILLQQQKYLNNLTEHALKKNQPLVVLNLMHGKTVISSAEELTGTLKIERMALQALTIRPLPGFQNTEISVPSHVVDEDRESSPNKLRTTQLSTAAAILDSDLPQIISVIQSFPHGIRKIEKSLHDKFPDVPKFQLRNKVQEISEFSDNRWQVKKEILRKHGLSIPTGKGPKKMKSIATFLKKRCLPPSATITNLSKTYPQSSQKLAAKVESQHDCSCNHQ
ncbi:chromatin assembly factor 1 subunit FAS1-like [Salvia miltiorrhiza]|uniref:chromatin assembly factor 1 subunit FAS1-like n=1 Tax=Salvia miltiorrhiza TaxID=226208 RepID=UPI0025AC0114|nr:chromatin assembly factor 1 subunit FAS1-like [Salvia miltiorrhiza]